jgi:hypothetical protein
VVASDRLFFGLFLQRSQRLQPLIARLLVDRKGYGFLSPVIIWDSKMAASQWP